VFFRMFSGKSVDRLISTRPMMKEILVEIVVGLSPGDPTHASPNGRGRKRNARARDGEEGSFARLWRGRPKFLADVGGRLIFHKKNCQHIHFADSPNSIVGASHMRWSLTSSTFAIRATIDKSSFCQLLPTTRHHDIQPGRLEQMDPSCIRLRR
jgi:hypothetical protein